MSDSSVVDGLETQAWTGSSVQGVGARDDRAEGLFHAQSQRNLIITDRAFAVLLAVEWVAAVALAIWLTPYTWSGTKYALHYHVIAATALGGLIVAPPILLAWLQPGKPLTRHVVAVAQMLISALFIHLSRGRIETHFHVFGSLAFLATYRDWRVLATATLVIAVDHAWRGWFFPMSVYGTTEPEVWRTLEHVGWVVFEDVFLIVASGQSNRSQQETARQKVNELGQYHLLERLGVGGMGEVYRAEHHLLKRSCALKLIRAEKAGDAKMLERFEREVQATAQLQHPCSIRIYDYGQTEQGRFFYVMEYLTGQSLTELVKSRGPVKPNRAIRLLRQTCGALAEAHGKGMVHRDVNPSNVFVCEMGGLRDVVKLLDFGLVQASKPTADDPRLTQEGFFLGTPAYVSPEQAKGKSVDGRSDLYSLGCVAYFLLTGHPVFICESTLETLMAHAREPAPVVTEERPEVPEELAGVILRCLEKNPEDRYATAQELDQALAECQNGAGDDANDSSATSQFLLSRDEDGT